MLYYICNKPMNERSSFYILSLESRRRWDCGVKERSEWTREGRAKGEIQVVADGSFIRYQRRTYSSTLNEWVHSINSGGTAGNYSCPVIRGRIFNFKQTERKITMKKTPYRIILSEEHIPKQWYNLNADLKSKAPPLLNPQTREPATIDELSQVFCRTLSEQEIDTKNVYIDIPEPIVEYYKTCRPSPLIRAYALEKALDTPAKIYYKFEGNNTSGSHKLNSAIPQAYYAKSEGIQHLTTETGAGQWGTALAMACAYFGVDLTVYMVKGSYNQKPHRKTVMEVFGANVTASPSNTTSSGRAMLERFGNETSGSLGCAITEAVEHATSQENTRYTLGSVLNQVLLHQSIIGLETKTAMELYDEYPDIVIGCVGGGSSFGGFIGPFIKDKMENKHNPYFIAVEPKSCPSLSRGKYVYDFCDAGRITPLAKMYTLGNGFIPSSDHAGGLRYHGMSPIVSKLYDDKFIDEARAVEQTGVFAAAIEFSRVEGILPAPESAHAIKVAIDEAVKCREENKEKTILFVLTGTGHFDMSAYSNYLKKNMLNYVPTDEELQKGFDDIPKP